jgi:hypothetical protein
MILFKKNYVLIFVFAISLLISLQSWARRAQDITVTSFFSQEQGEIVLKTDVWQNIIQRYSPEITISDIKETIEKPDHKVKIVNSPPQYIYIKQIGSRLIHIKVSRKREIFWAESEQLIIWPDMTEEDIKRTFKDGGY